MARDFKFFLAGEWIESGEWDEITNPYDGGSVGRVALADEEHLESAVQAAQRAFEETRFHSAFRRAAALDGIVDGLTAREDEVAEMITRESGKPIRYSRGEVARAISTFTIAREEARRIGGEVLPLDITERTEGHFGFVTRVPIGPISAISPFNFPLNLVAHKVAPALACGNPIILKPPHQTPLTSLLLAEIVEEAEVVPGSFSVLPLPIAKAEGLIIDERFKMLSFTGSARVGWELKAKAGKKRVALELGGNAAAIVHSDADVDWAAERCAVGGFAFAGQVCISVQRIFVHRPIWEAFIERFLDRVRALRTGDPMDPETEVGPMIDEGAAKRAESWLEEAREGGAKILTGGTRQGNTIEPTVLTEVTPEMKVSCEEVFAPIKSLIPYDEFPEAVRGVDESRYGLQAGLFTRDVGRIEYAYNHLEVGGLIVNDYPTFRVDNMPYGGVKDSGLGREGVKYAIQEMTELRLLVLRNSGLSDPELLG